MNSASVSPVSSGPAVHLSVGTPMAAVTLGGATLPGHEPTFTVNWYPVHERGHFFRLGWHPGMEVVLLWPSWSCACLTLMLGIRWHPSDSPGTHSTSSTLDPGWSSRMGFHRGYCYILSPRQLLGGQRRKSVNVVWFGWFQAHPLCPQDTSVQCLNSSTSYRESGIVEERA